MSDTTSGVYRRITSFSGNTDVVALGGVNHPCRAMRADGAGVVQAVDRTGTQVAVPFAAGEMQPINAVTVIGSGTTVGGLTIYY